MQRLSLALKTRLRSRVFQLFITATALAGVSHTIGLDDSIYRSYLDITTSQEEKAAAIWLNNYQMDDTIYTVQGVKENLSGLTWNDDTKTLFGITNSNELIEINRTGELLRMIPLKGFQDTEAITWAGGHHFLIADERRQAVVQVTINDDTQTLDFDSSPKVKIGIRDGHNKGFEGIAWNPELKDVWVAKERDPMTLYTIKGFSENGLTSDVEVDQQPRINERVTSESSDLSGLHFDKNTGHLLILSDESQQLIEVTLHGKLVSTLGLGIIPRLNQFVRQAEGVTMDDRGDIYIVSEPNLLYRFTSQDKHQATVAGL